MKIRKKKLQYILLYFGVFWIFTPLAAQTTVPHTLEKIEISRLNDFERIEFSFKEVFEDPPVVDFDQGLIYLRLHQTTLGFPNRQFFFENSSKLIQKIRATQNQNSVLIEIILQSPALSFEGKLKVSQDTNLLWLDLNLDVVPRKNTSVEGSPAIAKEMEDRFLSGDQFPSTFEKQEPPPLEGQAFDASETLPIANRPNEDWVMTMMTMSLFLLLILLLLYIVFFIYNKFFAGRLPGVQGDFKIRLVSTFHISPKQKIIVIGVNDQQFFACGVSSSSINFLTPLNDEKDQSFLNKMFDSSAEKEIKTSEIRADFVKSLEAAREKAAEQENILQQKKRTRRTTKKKEEPSSIVSSDDSSVEASSTSSESSVRSKSFNTQVPPKIEDPVETESTKDPAMKKFAKELSQKLKDLKPIN